MRRLRPEASALVEVGILFLPAIPAFIWLWPRVSGTVYIDWVQSLAYIYVLCGSLFIGLRRWTLSQLGVNWRGLGVILACGAVLIAEQPLGFLAIGFPLRLRPFALPRLVGEFLFYMGLVGVVEELLFRGLVFRALADWHGPGLAVLGSAFGFALWHIGWIGSLILAPLLIGLFLGLVRWRAGGIAGLAVSHGLYDLLAAEWIVPIKITSLDQLLQLHIANPWAAVLGDGLLLAALIYLWKFYPRRLAAGH